MQIIRLACGACNKSKLKVVMETFKSRNNSVYFRNQCVLINDWCNWHFLSQWDLIQLKFENVWCSLSLQASSSLCQEVTPVCCTRCSGVLRHWFAISMIDVPDICQTTHALQYNCNFLSQAYAIMALLIQDLSIL